MTKQPSLSALQTQLDEVLAQLQSPDIDVEQALKLHEAGAKLVAQIEDRLKEVSLQIEQKQITT